MSAPPSYGILAVAHYLWGAVLIVLAGYWGYAALSTVRHMVTGTPAGNLLTAMVLAASWSVPFASVGLWLVRLGRHLSTGGPRLRSMVVRTHALLLVPGLLAVAIGMLSVRQAARSAAAGGGIGSPLAWVPLLLGAPMVLISLASLLLVRDPRR